MHRSSAQEPTRRTSRTSGSNRVNTSRLLPAPLAAHSRTPCRPTPSRASSTALQRNAIDTPSRRRWAPATERGREHLARRHVRDGACHRPAVDLHPHRDRVGLDAVEEVHRSVDRVEHPGRPALWPTAEPPSSSPTIGSPGRSSASRSRRSRSVSVSTTVTGSVGVLLVRTADAASSGDGSRRRRPRSGGAGRTRPPRSPVVRRRPEGCQDRCRRSLCHRNTSRDARH